MECERDGSTRGMGWAESRQRCAAPSASPATWRRRRVTRPLRRNRSSPGRASSLRMWKRLTAKFRRGASEKQRIVAGTKSLQRFRKRSVPPTYQPHAAQKPRARLNLGSTSSRRTRRRRAGHDHYRTSRLCQCPPFGRQTSSCRAACRRRHSYSAFLSRRTPSNPCRHLLSFCRGGCGGDKAAPRLGRRCRDGSLFGCSVARFTYAVLPHCCFHAILPQSTAFSS